MSSPVGTLYECALAELRAYLAVDPPMVLRVVVATNGAGRRTATLYHGIGIPGSTVAATPILLAALADAAVAGLEVHYR